MLRTQPGPAPVENVPAAHDATDRWAWFVAEFRRVLVWFGDQARWISRPGRPAHHGFCVEGFIGNAGFTHALTQRVLATHTAHMRHTRGRACTSRARTSRITLVLRSCPVMCSGLFCLLAPRRCADYMGRCRPPERRNAQHRYHLRCSRDPAEVPRGSPGTPGRVALLWHVPRGRAVWKRQSSGVVVAGVAPCAVVGAAAWFVVVVLRLLISVHTS